MEEILKIFSIERGIALYNEYSRSLLILTFSVIFIFLLNSLILNKLKKLSKKPGSRINEFFIDIVKKNIIPILYISSLFIILREIEVSGKFYFIIKIFSALLISFYSIRFISNVFKYILEHYWTTKAKSKEKINSYKGIFPAFNIVIWIIGVIFILDNLGVNISTLLAGLGIGGIALALASQTILADLFSYFAMIFDRPFEIGDFIVIDNFMGTVEHIGVKTTRIRSQTGEEVIFANKDLTNSRVRNFKRMKRRRITFKLNIAYKTALPKIKIIPEIIKNIITKFDLAEFERAHCFSLGESALEFEIVYTVLSDNYNTFMDIQEKINMQILEKFSKNRINFAYPTQSVQLLK